LRPNFNKIVDNWSGRYAARMRLQHHTTNFARLSWDVVGLEITLYSTLLNGLKWSLQHVKMHTFSPMIVHSAKFFFIASSDMTTISWFTPISILAYIFSKLFNSGCTLPLLVYTAASANVYRYKVHARSVSENSCNEREWSPYTLKSAPARLFICTDTFILLACKPHDYTRSTVHWWTSSLTRNCTAFRPDLAMLAKRNRTTTRQAEEQVNSVSLRGKNYNELFEISIYMYSWNFTEFPANTVNFVDCKIKHIFTNFCPN
jgi:hypothetical protein